MAKRQIREKGRTAHRQKFGEQLARWRQEAGLGLREAASVAQRRGFAVDWQRIRDAESGFTQHLAREFLAAMATIYGKNYALLVRLYVLDAYGIDHTEDGRELTDALTMVGDDAGREVARRWPRLMAENKALVLGLVQQLAPAPPVVGEP